MIKKTKQEVVAIVQYEFNCLLEDMARAAIDGDLTPTGQIGIDGRIMGLNALELQEGLLAARKEITT